MNSVPELLELMDSQRRLAFAALEGLTDAQLWERPAPKEWSIGEILDHNNRLYATFFPLAKAMWKWLGWYGQRKRNRPYEVEIEDVYRRPSFPHWVGFLWSPKHAQLPLAVLRSETEALHAEIRAFYSGKDPDVLGNLYVYDPVFGWCNLIVTLRIGIHHNQLHYEDALKQARVYSLPADSAKRGIGVSETPLS
jgi:hypothetical protein